MVELCGACVGNDLYLGAVGWVRDDHCVGSEIVSAPPVKKNASSLIMYR